MQQRADLKMSSLLSTAGKSSLSTIQPIPHTINAHADTEDCELFVLYSLSMKDKEKFQIAQAVAKSVIDTLTRQDYVNVICARASHWDEVGK